MQNAQETIQINYGNKQDVIAQFNSIDSFASSDYLSRYASNFGYQHLVDREMNFWKNKAIVHNFFITSANADYNYGLDFKIWINYSTNEGMNFCKEFSLGSKSLNNAGLKLVQLDTKMPVGLSDDFDNIDLLNEFAYNIKNNIIESIRFSDVSFKKDAEYRHLLRKRCEQGQIFG